MSSNMIQAAACGESDASFQAIGLYELAHGVFQCVTHVSHVNTGLDDASHVLPHLHGHQEETMTALTNGCTNSLRVHHSINSSAKERMTQV